MYFVNVLGSPDRKYWTDTDGVIAQLLRIWELHKTKRNFVKRILIQCALCIKNKRPYLGQTLANERLKGRTSLIEAGSVDEGIVADWMEAGLGFRYTTKMVN